MALVLHLEPELEKQLHAFAAKRGMTGEDYARMVLEVLMRTRTDPTETGLPFYLTATPEEWMREFQAWVESHRDIEAPPIPAEALRRESLYEDRGL